MPQEIRQKKSFGGVDVDHFSPALADNMPRAINIHMKFEEGLKLYFSLGQLLGKLNSYNRSTRAGKRTGANICVYTKKNRITVNEGRTSARDASSTPESDESASTVETP